MTSTEQHIAHARRALSEAQSAASSHNGEDVHYAVSATLAFLGGARQILAQDDKFIYSFDDQDVAYAAVIGLRNVAFHVVGVPVVVNVAVPVEVVSAHEAGVTAILTDITTGESRVAARSSSASPAAPATPAGEATAEYRVAETDLPSTYLHTLKGHPRPSLQSARALLASTNILTVLERAIEFFDKTVLPAARAQGQHIP